MEQGSSDWHVFRSKGLGSSDAPVVMGVSPWKTRLKLYHEKVDGVVSDESNFATERGNRLEPVARTQFELLKGLNYEPKLFVHHDHDWLRASLDGYNEETNTILEIKCPGKEDHETAKSGSVPEKYIWQLEHQLLVSGALYVNYYSFDGENGELVEYYSDHSKRKVLFEEEMSFWFNHVLKKIPPALSKDDVLTISDGEAILLFGEYKKYKAISDEATKEMDRIKDLLVKKYGSLHDKVECDGVRVSRSERKGSVDYTKVIEKEGLNVDLERYRKPPTVTYTVTMR